MLPTLETVATSWAPRFGALAVAVALPILAYGVTGRVAMSHMFLVSQVSVEGNERVGHDEILRHASLDRPQSVLSFHAGTVRERLEHHPWIRYAEVTLGARDRSVHIVIEERELAAIAMFEVPMLVDTFGEVIAPWSPGDGVHVPILLQMSEFAADDLPQLVEAASSIDAVWRPHGATVRELHDLGVWGLGVKLSNGLWLELKWDEVGVRAERAREAVEAAPPGYVVERVRVTGDAPDRAVLRGDERRSEEEGQ
jgi:cell division septal protein FtsQ